MNQPISVIMNSKPFNVSGKKKKAWDAQIWVEQYLEIAVVLLGVPEEFGLEVIPWKFETITENL